MAKRIKNSQIMSDKMYLFCQPGYSAFGMDYREYYVPAASFIYEYVSLYYEASTKAVQTNIPVIPDGCIDLVMAYTDGHCTGISICGTITSLYAMQLKDTDYIFGIRFKPGKCPLLREGAIKEFVDNQHQIKMMDKDIRFVNDLISAKSFRERIMVAEQYIGVSCGSSSCKQNMVDYTMRCIYSSDGNESIRKISDEMVYSPRYLESVFKDLTGFTPKGMCRLVRVHKAVLMLLWDNTANRTCISQECGYSDLSHMNRDLKSILGLNSSQINKNDFYISDFDEKNTVYNF